MERRNPSDTSEASKGISSSSSSSHLSHTSSRSRSTESRRSIERSRSRSIERRVLSIENKVRSLSPSSSPNHSLQQSSSRNLSSPTAAATSVDNAVASDHNKFTSTAESSPSLPTKTGSRSIDTADSQLLHNCGRRHSGDSPLYRMRMEKQRQQRGFQRVDETGKQQQQDRTPPKPLEPLDSLQSALSQETALSDMTHSTIGNPADEQQQQPQKQPEKQVELTRQKVIPSPTTSNKKGQPISKANEEHSQQPPQTSSWWLNMFHRLEAKHEKERTTLQEQLHSAKEKKHQYKDELRQNLSTQLKWLEEHITAPNHVLPGISRLDTGITSGSTNYQSKYTDLDGPTGSGSSNSASAKGVEVTLDSAEQMQRLQQLEHILHETTRQYESDRSEWERTEHILQEALRQHEVDRSEWVCTLEEAAAVTQAGEDLSAQQQQQLEKLQKTIVRSEKESEKIKVLNELLELTEKQQIEDREEWEKEQEKLNNTIAQLQSSKDELEQSKNEEIARLQSEKDELEQSAEKELADWKEKAAQAEREAAALHEEKETLTKEKENISREVKKLHKDLEDVKAESRNYRAQAADFTEQVAMRSGRQDGLDRIMAERDAYRQEAESLRRERDALRKNQYSTSPSLASSPSLSVIQLETKDKDIMTKYRESVEKHGDLVGRLKRLEDQRATDRDTFKLQLEAALAESRQLNEEKNALETRLQESSRDQPQEVQHWKGKANKLEVEMRYQLDQLVEKHHVEVSELKERLDNAKREHTKAVNELQRFREQQWGTRSDNLKTMQEDNRKLNSRVDELSKSLAEHKGLHNKAVKRLDHALAEKSRLKEELDASRSCGGGRDTVPESELVGRIEKQHNLVFKAMKELRADVATVKETLSVTSATDNLTSLREDLTNIQNTLNDAVAELTLEADALIQSRHAFETADSTISDAFSSKDSKDKTSFLEQREQLMKEFGVLREKVTKAMEQRDCATSNNEGAVSREIVADLQRKEAALATAQAELKFCKEKLESEIASRQALDAQVATFQEQSEAYEDEILTLRSANTKLIKKLQTAGMKMDAAILAGRMPTSGDDLSTVATPRSMSMTGDNDSFAALDEALALATGLTGIVGKRGTSALEMLESMQDMIDETESTSAMSSPASSLSPRHRNRKVYDTTMGADGIEISCRDGFVPSIEMIHEEDSNTETTDEPKPKRPPALKHLSSQVPISNESALQLVVERLYSRCEMLERERISTMEATLDLLESARNANGTELDAALATVRRRSTEEMLRIRHENYQDQERIFHRLCTQCVRSPTSRRDRLSSPRARLLGLGSLGEET